MTTLTEAEILSAYDQVSVLYPRNPPMCLWRAWELAAYRRHRLIEPVLDIGCGDGRFFRQVFPGIGQVVGVDHDSETAAAARKSGAYQAVHVAPADRIPLADESFASAFANCSLEHMDNLPGVLREIHRLLRPGGSFLFSVVTDKFLTWNPLPMLTSAISGSAAGQQVSRNHVRFHHLVNALPPEQWTGLLSDAGFEGIESLSIVPELCSRVFLFFDSLWHVQSATGDSACELGRFLEPYIASFPQFASGFRQILASLIRMEVNPDRGCGLVLRASRPTRQAALGFAVLLKNDSIRE